MQARRRTRPAVALAVALATAALLSACVVQPRPVVVQPARAEVVVIRAGHAHSHRCGHYFHRGRWYFQRGHVHGRGCGHVHVHGVWRLR